MKQKTICLTLALILACAVPAGAAPATDPRPRPCLVSVAAGGLLEFSAADLELRMGLPAGSLEGVTVTALPALPHGALYLDGVEVAVYEFLDRDALDRLCFAAGELAGTTTMGLLPRTGSGAQVSLNIRVLDESNGAPSLSGAAVQTGRNISAFGSLAASDPEGDELHLVLTRAPSKGELRLTGLSYRYDPYHNRTGSDYFTVCAVDVHGNYSAEVTVDITIDKQKLDFHYTDMVVHPSQYAALMLHDAGVYTGHRIGTGYFFEPEQPMNRGDFLMLLIAAAGLSDTMTPTVNTGLPNDAEIPSHLKRYVCQAVRQGILSPDLSFAWDEIPSRAEAVVLIDRAAGITDVKSYALTMPDVADIPLWARESYRDLAAYQMLDLHDGRAHPARPLDNAYAADLGWQLCKHARR